MKKVFIIAAVALFSVACGNNNDKGATLSDPNTVQPEAEAVPDSLKIVNDSAIVPDSKQGEATNGTK